MLNILGITGSTKNISTSRVLLNYIKKTFSETINLTVYNQLAELPHFNPDLEKELPDSILNLRNKIENADGIIFCTPEYVYSIPGSLKNLIEWNVSTVLFSNKPVAIIVAAASGKKAFESLQLILSTIEASITEESCLLIQGAGGKIDKTNGKVNQEIASKVDKLVNSLVINIEDTNRTAHKSKV